MFPPAIDIISTSLAVAYSDGKYTNKKIEASPRDILSNLISYSCFRWPAMEPRLLRAHQKEVEEWPVGIFCKYNVLLGNLPLYYRMFPPAIDRIPKLTHVGGGGERGVDGHISSGGPYVQPP